MAKKKSKKKIEEEFQNKIKLDFKFLVESVSYKNDWKLVEDLRKEQERLQEEFLELTSFSMKEVEEKKLKKIQNRLLKIHDKEFELASKYNLLFMLDPGNDESWKYFYYWRSPGVGDGFDINEFWRGTLKIPTTHEYKTFKVDVSVKKEFLMHEFEKWLDLERNKYKSKGKKFKKYRKKDEENRLEMMRLKNSGKSNREIGQEIFKVGTLESYSDKVSKHLKKLNNSSR